MNTITERSMQKKETLIGRMWSLSLRIQMGSDKAPPNTKADHCPAGRGAAVWPRPLTRVERAGL